MVRAVSFDVLIVLGCRVYPDGSPSAALRRRLETALALWRTGRADRILLSGGRRWGGWSEAEVMREVLGAAGLPRRSLFVELRSLSTVENARFCREWLREQRLERAGVVTSDYHLARALRAFRELGVTATGIASPSPPLPLTRRAQRSLGERLRRVTDRAHLTWLARGGLGP